MRRTAALSTLAVVAALAAGVPAFGPAVPAAAAVTPERALATSGAIRAPDVSGIGAWFEPTDQAGPLVTTFTAQVAGGTVAARPDGLRLDLPGAHPASVGVRFVDSSGSTPAGTTSTPTKVSYLIGDDPAGWRTSVPTYQGVRYADVWPGVDLDYDINRGHLKGTWRLAAGVPVSQVRWRYDGATVAAQAGQLVVTPTAAGAPRITERAPVAWQEGPHGRTSVKCHYVLDGTVGFTCGVYDVTRPLVIDPDVDWTYVDNCPVQCAQVNDLAVTPDGGVVAGGVVQSKTKDGRDVTWQTRGVQPAYGGGTSDGWLGRWTTDGALAALTYVGNEAAEVVDRVAVEPNGSVAFTARTAGATFPGPGETRNPVPGEFLPVVGVLTPDLTEWVSTTFLPQSTQGIPRGLVAAANGDLIVLVQVTFSERSKRPAASPGAAAATVPNGGYVSRLDPAGRPRWTATIGTDSHPTTADTEKDDVTDVELLDLALDSADDVYLVGSADTDALSTTPGAVQPARHGHRDGFVMRLAADGSAIRWRTFYGGSGSDRFTRVALDPRGTVVAMGDTTSSDFPGATGCARGNSDTNSDTDLSVVAISPEGGRIRYARCIGGTATESAGGGATNPSTGLAVDDAGSVYLSGGTTSTDFPTLRAWQPTGSSAGSDVVVKLDPAGDTRWASYHGGPLLPGGAYGLAVRADGGVYMAGITSSGAATPGGADADPRGTGSLNFFVSLIRQDAADLAVTPAPAWSPTSSASATSSASGTSSASATGSTSPTASASASASLTPSASTTTSASPTASPSADGPSGAAASSEQPSSSPSCSAGRLMPLDPAIVAGQRARVRYLGPPGARVTVEGYSRRPGEQPTYRIVRPAATVPASGVVDYAFVPTTNTRLRAVTDCGASDSAVLRVAPSVSLVARRVERLSYLLSGRVSPAAPTDGASLAVTYRAADGHYARKAVTRVAGGRWSVRVRFTGPTRLVLRAVTAATSLNASGASRDLALTVR
jgi:hypothetical protein